MFLKARILKLIFLILFILIIGRWSNNYLVNYYEKNWNQVSNLVIVLAVLTWTIFIFNRVKNYQRSTYLWNKLLGMNEINIFMDFMKKNVWSCLILIFTILCFGNFSGIWNSILFCANIPMLLFRSGYNENRTGKFVILGEILWGIVLVIIVMRSIILSASVHEIISTVSSSFIVTCVVYYFKSLNIILIALGLIIAALLVYTFPKYDERVCRNFMFSFKKWSELKVLRKKNCFRNGSIGRQLSYIFCYIKYSLYFVVIYISYIFLAVNVSNNHDAFCIITVVYSIMIGGCIDFVFHVDSYNRQWYKVLGETYHGFFSKKVIMEYLLQLPVTGIFLICSWFCHYPWQSIVLIFVYSMLYGFGWVLYFASYYVDMREHYVKLELVRMYVVMLLIINPVTNLLMCPYWYKTGKRRWTVYVGDSQLDKTVQK